MSVLLCQCFQVSSFLKRLERSQQLTSPLSPSLSHTVPFGDPTSLDPSSSQLSRSQSSSSLGNDVVSLPTALNTTAGLSLLPAITDHQVNPSFFLSFFLSLMSFADSGINSNNLDL